MKRRKSAVVEKEGYSSKRKAKSTSPKTNSAGSGLDLDESSLQLSNPEDQYYSVRQDLKVLFNSTSESGGGFSFLGEQTKNSQKEHKTEENLKSQLPKTLECPRYSQNDPISEKRDIKYLFFHCESDALRNRMEDNSFVRSQPLEELEADWPDRRTAMKHSFRKRHKEALKLGKRRRNGAGQKNDAE